MPLPENNILFYWTALERVLLFCARRAHSIIPHTVWGTRERGIFSFSKENIPLTPPRERTRGAPLDPQHWQFAA